MSFFEIFSNDVLIATLTAWFSAQVLKIPIEYLRTKELNWAIFLSTGGMPSSHTAVVSGLALGIGLWQGFDTPLFAMSFVLSMVVVYDATGIRRQAGKHARLINTIMNDLTTGHPIKEAQQQELKEILGHTWLEAIVGIAWGLLIVYAFWIQS